MIPKIRKKLWNRSSKIHPTNVRTEVREQVYSHSQILWLCPITKKLNALNTKVMRNSISDFHAIVLSVLNINYVKPNPIKITYRKYLLTSYFWAKPRLRASHNFLHKVRFIIMAFNSAVDIWPVSRSSVSTRVVVGRPRDADPCLGCHKTVLWAGDDLSR